MPIANENADLPGGDEVETTKNVAEVPAPKAKPKPAEPKVEEPTKNRHTDRFTRLALNFGFSQADLDNHTTAEIQAEIDWHQSQIAKREAAKAAPAKEPVVVDEDEEFVKELEAAEGVDPKYVAFTKRQTAEVKQTKKQLAELLARDKARDQAALEDAAEAAFADLAKDPKVAALIGTGDASACDPGEIGWRRAIAQKAGLTEQETPQTLRRKIVTAGKAEMSRKLGGGSPPPPPAPVPAPKKKHDVRAQDGKFTEEDFAAGKLPVPGNRLLAGAPDLEGAAGIHAYLKSVGDSRADLGFVDTEDASDLP